MVAAWASAVRELEDQPSDAWRIIQNSHRPPAIVSTFQRFAARGRAQGVGCGHAGGAQAAAPGPRPQNRQSGESAAGQTPRAGGQAAGSAAIGAGCGGEQALKK